MQRTHHPSLRNLHVPGSSEKAEADSWQHDARYGHRDGRQCMPYPRTPRPSLLLHSTDLSLSLKTPVQPALVLSLRPRARCLHLIGFANRRRLLPTPHPKGGAPVAHPRFFKQKPQRRPSQRTSARDDPKGRPCVPPPPRSCVPRLRHPWPAGAHGAFFGGAKAISCRRPSHRRAPQGPCPAQRGCYVPLT